MKNEKNRMVGGGAMDCGGGERSVLLPVDVGV